MSEERTQEMGKIEESRGEEKRRKRGDMKENSTQSFTKEMH